MVFFCFAFLLNCNSNNNTKIKVTVAYKEHKAVAVHFNGIDDTYAVYLNEHSKTAVLGNFSFEKEMVNFTPLVPFTPGETYHLYKDTLLVSSFHIKQNSSARPELITIYPTRDTVPENLLKMYFVFSEPMQEVGDPLDYITIQNTGDQKEESIFLHLEAELWNKEHTQLTLWLDPGRIKTDLIPNKEKGLPIIKGNTYDIQIDSNWRAANGQTLKETYRKHLYVSSRDTHSPLVSEWEIEIPKANTLDALTIDFKESLDAILVAETIHFFNADSTGVYGEIDLQLNEKGILFYPENPWVKGKFTIQVASKLEDLSGNNLNHLFDRNLQTSDSGSKATTHKFIDFYIR